MLITTTLGDIDDSLLQKREGEINNDNELTTSVEYCPLGCTGDAHRTNIADSPSHFCNHHIHRSVHVTLKQFESIAGTAASFG